MSQVRIVRDPASLQADAMSHIFPPYRFHAHEIPEPSRVSAWYLPPVHKLGYLTEQDIAVVDPDLPIFRTIRDSHLEENAYYQGHQVVWTVDMLFDDSQTAPLTYLDAIAKQDYSNGAADIQDSYSWQSLADNTTGEDFGLTIPTGEDVLWVLAWWAWAA